MTALRQGVRVPPRRVLFVGRSHAGTCGVRDHAAALEAELAARDIEVVRVWSVADEAGRSLDDIGRSVAGSLRNEPPDAIVVHYSVFAFSRRGIPTAVPRLAFRLMRLGVPVVLFAHEYASSFQRRGLRGMAQALIQRVALVPMVAVASAVVVTTEDRVRWFRTRRWLPRRAVAFAPVFSNIPPTAGLAATEVEGRIGIFSFGAEGLESEVAVTAVAAAAQQFDSAHLILIGAPGPDSPAGRAWQAAADAAGCPISFTGVLEAAEVSSQLARCAIVLFPDRGGPSSRKTSLAASLVHGRPVVALAGRHCWTSLIDNGGVSISEPNARSLATTVVHLLTDEAARRDLARRAHAFAAERLTPAATADTILQLVDDRARSQPPGMTLRRSRRSRMANEVGR